MLYSAVSHGRHYLQSNFLKDLPMECVEQQLQNLSSSMSVGFSCYMPRLLSATTSTEQLLYS
jgi:hypothetical protein